MNEPPPLPPSPSERWLAKIRNGPLIELIIQEVTGKMFKAYINSGRNQGLQEWFNIEAWQFVELLPPLRPHGSETASPIQS